jgi:hypothetical protein
MIDRLLLGIPHGLVLSNNNGELQLLVPSLLPIRPKIGDSPFSTTLVMKRDETSCTKGWLGDARYFLYPVHVSFSFLFMPTLCSAMYMVLLRYLNMNFAESCKLAPSVATDAELSSDESLIFEAVLENQVQHPDSYGFLLHFMVALSQSPSCHGIASHLVKSVEFGYLKRLQHVSFVCRLDRLDELRLINAFGLLPSKNPWEPLYNGNRKNYLNAVLGESIVPEMEKENSDPNLAKVISVSSPIRLKNAHWIWRRDLEIFKDEDPWKTLSGFGFRNCQIYFLKF